MTPQRTNIQKSLRSLNDVLGKSLCVGKETKAVPGSPSLSISPFQVENFVNTPFNYGLSLSQALRAPL